MLTRIDHHCNHNHQQGPWFCRIIADVNEYVFLGGVNGVRSVVA